MKLATIDIGTNTTLLLVAEGTRPDDLRVLADRAEITRLGRGIGGDGRLGEDGIDRTLGALQAYAEIARAQGAPIAAVGTEALRRAPNAADFLGPAAEILGGPVEVIDGEREAALTFLAAVRSFPALAAAGPILVIDIGGGSTELIAADRGTVRLRTSLPLGSVRLTERHVRHDPPTPAEVEAIFRDVEAALDPVALPRGVPLVGTAGTVTTLAAMAQGLGSYDPTLVHGYRLALPDLERQVARLACATQAEREAMPGLDPRRADVILAGACVLTAIARRLGALEVVVNDRGIRWGLLYERL